MWPFTRKRNGREGRPRRDWPWTLHVGEELWPNFDTWEMVEPELRELNLEDPDSFLILEQRDPRDAGRYWFILGGVRLVHGAGAGFIRFAGAHGGGGHPLVPLGLSGGGGGPVPVHRRIR